MGIDIFLAVSDILVGIALTWFIIWYFLMPSMHQQAADEATSKTSPSLQTSQAAAENQATTTPTTESAAVQESTAAQEKQYKHTQAKAAEQLRTEQAHSKILTIIAGILTTPVLLIDLNSKLEIAKLPSLLTSPWFQAILITPVVFYCGRPIYADSWKKITTHQTSMSTLATIAVALTYSYSLAACALPQLLPEGSRQAYFDVIGVITIFALIAKTTQQQAQLIVLSGKQEAHARNKSKHNSHNKPSLLEEIITQTIQAKTLKQEQIDRVVNKAEPIVMIIAVWTFLVWLLVGPQPHLAHAVANASSVLTIAAPASLILVIPFAYHTTLSAGSTQGLLFTSHHAIASIANTKTVAIDESAINESAINKKTTNKDDSTTQLARASTHLRLLGVTSIVMESSKGNDYIEQASRQAGVDFLFTGVDSERKARWIERIIHDLHQEVGLKANRQHDKQEQAQLVAFATDRSKETPGQAAAQVNIAFQTSLNIRTENEDKHSQGQQGQQAAKRPDLILSEGNIPGIAQAIELARSCKKTIHHNLSWGYLYNLGAIITASGILYPLTGWMLNPIIAPITAFLAGSIGAINLRRLNKHTSLRKHWESLSHAQATELPTLAARRPQVIADGGHQFGIKPELHPELHPDLPDQTR